MVSICSGWEFSGLWSEEFLSGEGTYPVVDLPHNVKEISLHYASPSDYEGIYGYRRVIECGSELAGKRVFLQLDGAAHIAQVFLNGELLSEHPVFFLINSYTTGLQPAVLSYMLHTAVLKERKGRVEAEEIGLPVSSNGLVLPCGASGRIVFD